MVHKCLKSQWSITETKEHDHGFEEAEGSDECGLPLILFSNVDVIVSPPDIELGEKGGIFHVVNQLRNEGERVSITDGMAVKVVVVLARVQSSIFFGTKKNGAACGDLESTIHPVFKCSSMKALQASFAAGLSR